MVPRPKQQAKVKHLEEAVPSPYVLPRMPPREIRMSRLAQKCLARSCYPGTPMVEVGTALGMCGKLLTRWREMRHSRGGDQLALEETPNAGRSIVAIVAMGSAKRAVNMSFTGCLAKAIAMAFDCESSCHVAGSPSLEWSFHGEPEVAAAAARAFEIAYNTTLSWSTACTHAVQRHSYCLGVAHGLFSALDKEKREEKRAAGLADQFQRQRERYMEWKRLMPLARQYEEFRWRMKQSLRVIRQKNIQYHREIADRLANIETAEEQDVFLRYHQDNQRTLFRKSAADCDIYKRLQHGRYQQRAIAHRGGTIARENEILLADILANEKERGKIPVGDKEDQKTHQVRL